MALDRQTLVNKLRASGAFTESEIESEADTMMKDDRAAERRDTLNSTKVAAEPVATTQPAPAASVAPPAASVAPPAASVASPATSILSVPTVPAGTTAAQLVNGDVTPTGMGTPPETRVKKVGENVVDAGGDLVQNAIDYFSTFPNYHPNITGAAAAVPIAYAAHKAAQATGLYDTLVSKMANSNAPAQPQPFVGGAGPRVTPPAPVVTPAASPIQNWDIHSDPSFGNFLGDGTAPAAAPAATTEAPPAKPNQNLSLAEATDRLKNVVPAATPVTPEAAPAKAPWAPPTAEVINKPSMLPSGSTLAPSAAVSPEGAPVNPVEPNAEEVAAAKAAEETKAKIPLFSDADKKAFTSEQRSVLQHMQYGQTPEEAKNLLRHFENTLPEGVKLSYGTYPEDVYNEAGKKIKTAGTSKGGFPEPKQNLLDFWNEALGTNHTLNEKGNFDYKPTPEDVTKAHSYWSEKMANATTPAAKSIAEKGYASLGALAKLAGISLGALGAMHAYKTGKETGDWSDLGLLGGSLLAGASVPAQIAYQGLTYSKPLGETQEQLNQLGKQLEYAGKVGYGRGLVNPSNAIPPPRHTMTNR
jgi:hypothetical protein